MSDDNSSENTSDGLGTVVGGATLVFLGRVSKLALTFGVQIVMARFLPTTSYGGVVLTITSYRVTSLISHLGIPSGVTRNVPHYEEDTDKVRGVVKGAFKTVFVSSLVASTLMIVLAPIISTRIFNQPELTVLLRIAALGLPITSLGSIAVSTAKGTRDAKTHVIVNQILNPIFTLSLVSLFVYLGYEAVGVISGQIAANVLTAIAALYLAYRVIPFSIFGPTVSMTRELLTFSLPLLLSAGMNFVLFNTDTLLIGMLLEAAQVGIYNVAFQIRGIGMFFFYPLAYLLPPVLTRLAKRNEWQEARRTYQVVSKWMVLLSLPVFLGFMFFPEVILRATFGPRYVGGATVLQILMIPVIVTVLLGANDKALVALGYNKLNMYVNIAGAVLNLVLNLVLIPQFGTIGAASATAFALIARDILFSLMLYRKDGLQPLSRAMLKPFVGTSLLAILGYALFIQFVEPTFLSVAVVGFLSLGIYLPLIVVLDGIEDEDERLLDMVENRIGFDLVRVRAVANRLR